MKNSLSLISLNDPHSIAVESYKIFRTNLSYLNVDQPEKVILFTSSTMDEGKTTSICNTAVTFAANGKKVLLIDCDLRKSRIHKLFDQQQSPGVTNVLADKLPLGEAVQSIAEYENLHILVAGPHPPNPAEMLATQAFEKLVDEARQAYDLVLIDAPPVLSVADASVLSRWADGVVLIVAASQTRKEEARQAKRALEKVGANILGVLLCKVDMKKHKYYYYYGNK